MATDDLLADGGPAFDPEAAAAEPTSLAPDATAGGELWTVQRVRALLSAKGELLHGTIAIDPESTEWRYTSADLQSIAPALTRILNRHEVTRAAAAGGDEMQLAIGFAGYGMRSWSERRAAIAAQRAAGDYELTDDEDEQVAYADVEPEPPGDFPPDGTRPPIPPLRGR